MEERPGWRQVPLDDRDWWASWGEDYWQALLEHGELPPETVPTPPLQDPLFAPGQEPDKQSSPPKPAASEGDQAETDGGWQKAQLALELREVFRLTVSGANRGGLLVSWNGLQGFVPASHLAEMPHYQDTQDRMAQLTSRIGDPLKVSLIEVDTDRQRLVFSERAAASGNGPTDSILDTLQPGTTCEGSVTNLTSFGAFVDLGGVEGLVHISEISWDRVQHPGDVLHPGQAVRVYVVGVNPEEKRIALSLKRLRPDPWTEVEARYQVGDLLDGTVTNVVSFGAFVRVEEGLEGLVHITELAEGQFMHPQSVVQEGDQVQVRVLNVNKSKHRLGLSLRQAHNPEGMVASERQEHGEPA